MLHWTARLKIIQRLIGVSVITHCLSDANLSFPAGCVLAPLGLVITSALPTDKISSLSVGSLQSGSE